MQSPRGGEPYVSRRRLRRRRARERRGDGGRALAVVGEHVVVLGLAAGAGAAALVRDERGREVRADDGDRPLVADRVAAQHLAAVHAGRGLARDAAADDAAEREVAPELRVAVAQVRA